MAKKRVSMWRGMGAILETGVGASAWRASAGVVNRFAAVATPNLRNAIPWTEVKKPLAGARVAVITTSGLYLDGDEPFDVDALEGDTSFRTLPRGFDPADIRVAHTHYPHRYVEQDVNVLLPVDHLRWLEAHGVVELAPRWFSFGYGGTQVQAYIDPEQGTAHQVAARLEEDQVDIALLVPA